MAQNTTDCKIEIRSIAPPDVCLFHELASSSTLCSLKDPSFLQELIERGHVIVAFCGDQLIGCSCLQVNICRDYISLDGAARSLPLPNVYLCSTFVQQEYRRSGVGLRLYAERLRVAKLLQRSTLAVEILGRGVPLTIDSIAHVGYRFHLEAGFHVAGYSSEIDHGPVLMCSTK
jgi:GNAT superfamily N-acetyltransferase